MACFGSPRFVVLSGSRVVDCGTQVPFTPAKTQSGHWVLLESMKSVDVSRLALELHRKSGAVCDQTIIGCPESHREDFIQLFDRLRLRRWRPLPQPRWKYLPNGAKKCAVWVVRTTISSQKDPSTLSAWLSIC